MKSALPALRARLLVDPGVAAIVSNRIWTYEAMEGGTFPDLVIYPVSTVPLASLAGMIPPWTERLSCECRAIKFSTADALSVAVVAALNNASFTGNGVIVDGCLLASIASPFDGGFSVFRRIVDFTVSYRPAA